MNPLLSNTTPILCQSSLKAIDLDWIRQSLDYGANIVGITSLVKQRPANLPVPYFNSVQQAAHRTGATVSIISVPSPFCKGAILEALEANINLIICFTRHLPIHDMLKISWLLKSFNSQLIGPNSTGIIAPDHYKIGAIPHNLYLKGNIGIVSRSNTLMHEIAAQLTASNLGQSICLSIGSMTTIGSRLLDLIKLLEADDNTHRILVIDKIDTPLEKDFVRYLSTSQKKPIVYYLAGTAMLSQKGCLKRYLHHEIYHMVKEKLTFFSRHHIPVITSCNDIITHLSTATYHY